MIITSEQIHPLKKLLKKYDFFTRVAMALYIRIHNLFWQETEISAKQRVESSMKSYGNGRAGLLASARAL